MKLSLLKPSQVKPSQVKSLFLRISWGEIRAAFQLTNPFPGFDSEPNSGTASKPASQGSAWGLFGPLAPQALHHFSSAGGAASPPQGRPSVPH